MDDDDLVPDDVEAASRRYFGKSARFVTLPQAALLAGLLKAPSRYSPRRSVKLAGALNLPSSSTRYVVSRLVARSVTTTRNGNIR